MNQKKEKKQKKQNDASNPICKNRMVLLCTAFIGILLIGIEVYIYLERKDIPMMGGLAICFVVDLFMMVNSIMNIDQINKDKEQQNYEDLYKAQKASYLVIRRSFDELMDRLDDLEDSSGIPTEDILQAQKAIAKIILSRSQDNAEALMNSNVEVTKHLDSISDFTGSIDQKMKVYQTEALQQTKDLVREENREIIAEIRRLHDAIQNLQQNMVSITQAQHNLSVQSMMMSQAASQTVTQVMQPAATSPKIDEMDLSSEFTEPPMEDLEENFNEVPLEEFHEELDELSLDEDSLENTDEVVSDDLPLEETLEELDDLSLEDSEEGLDDLSLEGPVEETDDLSLDDLSLDGFDEDLTSEEETGENDSIEKDSIEMDDLSLDLDLDDISEEMEAPLEEPVEEPVVEMEPEPVAEPEVAVEIEPVSEDPNAKLSPDQIAAMFAQADGGAGERESVVEPEAAVEIEPVSEDPNAKLSPDQIAAMFAQADGAAAPEPEPTPEVQGDPNKMMSPEEIEALFKNM